MLVSYLARIGVTLLGAAPRGRISALDAARFPMRVWPADVDLYGHLNNGRFLTLMDFGRLDYVTRSGLLVAAMKRRWRPLASAATVRFVRELRVLERFELTTRVACWDHKYLYFEHRFEQRETVHAVGYVQIVTKGQGRTVAPAQILATVGVDGEAPVPPPELAGWIQSLAPLRIASQSARA